MPFDDPIRLRVLKAMSAALAEITPANGYVKDLSADADFPNGKVFRGRAMFGEADPIPMVSILEVPIPMEQMRSSAGNTATAGPWELIVQGFVADDHENPTDPAHILLADVKKRIALEKRRLSNGEAFGIKAISDIQLGPGVVRPPDEASSKAYFWLSVVIGLAEESADPYS